MLLCVSYVFYGFSGGGPDPRFQERDYRTAIISTYVGTAGSDARRRCFAFLRSLWYFWLRFSNILRLRSSFSAYSEAPELLLQFSWGSGIILKGFWRLRSYKFNYFAHRKSHIFFLILQLQCHYFLLLYVQIHWFHNFVLTYSIMLSFSNNNNDNKPIAKLTTKTTTNTVTTGFSSAFLAFSSCLQLSSLGL